MDDINSPLIDDFTKQEVNIALKQMVPLKASGPNDMPLNFCSIIGIIFLKFRSNFTWDWLYIYHPHPQGEESRKSNKIWPISVCNILYKLVFKALEDGLKNILPQIISNSQSVFQSDKAILDNILVAFETLHHMKQSWVNWGSRLWSWIWARQVIELSEFLC